MADLVANQIPKYAINPNSGVANLTPVNIVTLGSDANGLACYTAGVLGGRVYVLLASTTDTVAVNVFIYILNLLSVRSLGLVNVPLSSGNVANTPNVNLLDSNSLRGIAIDASGNRYIPLNANEVLKVGTLAAMTAARTTIVTAIGSDY